MYQDTDPRNLEAAPRTQEKKERLHRALMTLSLPELQARLAYQVSSRRPRQLSSDLDDSFIARVLDTSVGTTGNVLPRVDLEQTIRALLVTMFPWFDRIKKGQANGVVHSWNVATASGTATDANMIGTSELATVNDDTGVYKQLNNIQIATLLVQRGVSFKEEAAVAASGMQYDPATEELLLGTTRMKSLIQRLLLQGNVSKATGTLANEFGLYNANSFDGLRVMTSGTAPYNSPSPSSVVDIDLVAQGGAFTITQGINLAATGSIDLGGNPSLIVASAIGKNRLMNEQEGKQRTESADIIPGVKVSTVATINGDLPILMVPGAANALGSYLRTSDGLSVQDMYVLDEAGIYLRWLGSPDINVLEIPPGVNGQLSRRFILFAFYGMQMADNGAFQAKIRLPN